MIPTIIISALTFISVTLSILLFPKIKIGKIAISTYWLISLTGAVLLLCFSLAPIDKVWSELTNNNSINPLKIETHEGNAIMRHLIELYGFDFCGRVILKDRMVFEKII